MFELALELGMTVRGLLSQVDSHELAEWMAFFRVRNQPAQKAESDVAGGLRAAFSKLPKKV